MKKALKLLAIIALVTVICFSMAACGGDDDGDGGDNTATYTGTSGGQSYTLKITKAPARYTAQIGDAYELTIGSKKSTGTVSDVSGNTLTLTPTNAPNAPFTATVSGTSLTALNHTITWNDNTTAAAPGALTGGGGGGGTDNDSWFKWSDPNTNVTLDYSVANDGVCTITVGGIAEPDSEKWKAGAGYNYTAQAGKSYTYKFEAWTDSGTRNYEVEYYSENADHVTKQQTFPITSTRTTYTINGDPLPKGGNRSLFFHCANLLGTFYVKVLEIKEVGSSSGGRKGILTITGIPSKYNGKFAFAYGDDVVKDKSGKKIELFGGAKIEDFDMGPKEDVVTLYTPVAISGGKVEIPLFTFVKRNNYQAYDGNGDIQSSEDLKVYIRSTGDPARASSDYENLGYFDSGTFVNGSLTLRWDQGYWSRGN